MVNRTVMRAKMRMKLNHLLDFIGLNAACADIRFFHLAIVSDLDTLQIGFKLPFCLVMRVTDIIANLG